MAKGTKHALPSGSLPTASPPWVSPCRSMVCCVPMAASSSLGVADGSVGLMPAASAACAASAAALRRLVVLLCGVAVIGSGCADVGTDEHLRTVLAAMPAHAAERGIFVTFGSPSDGFGSDLPLAAVLAALDVAAADIGVVAESGGAPLTVLTGGIVPRTVRAAATEEGFIAREIAGWTVLRQTGQAGTALASVPAIAVRDGLAVLGSNEEVAAVVDGHPSAVTIPWMARAAEQLSDAGQAVAFGPSVERFADAAEAAGAELTQLLESAGSRGEIEPYEGYVITWSADGTGGIVLVYAPAAVTPDRAEALALRAATGPVAGEGRRAAADLLEGGAPRIDRSAGLVTLPVRWRTDDLDRLRGDIAAGRLIFLAPR
jgi:hypothetical protein